MPLKISLEITDPQPSELRRLAGFLVDYPTDGGIELPKNAEVSDSPIEPAPEASFSVKSEAAFGPTLVPDAPPPGNIDKAGLPWDERIHASTRALTADGLWRKKRGVDDATVTAVETQLRGVMAIPAVPPPPPPPVADFQTQFVHLIGRTAQALAAGKITQHQIQQCADAAGLPSIQMLFNRPDLLEKVRASVNAIIGE